jgi:hypothetical protein
MANEGSLQHPTGELFQVQLPLQPRTHATNCLPVTEEIARTPPTCPSRPSQMRMRLTELPYDILDPIVGFVAENKKHLLNLCLASIVLYTNCIPWIYRHVVINFSDPEIYGLLQRLCYTLSQIPTYVRSIALKDCGSASLDQWTLLDQALWRFTRLKNLRWDSHTGIPEYVLYTLHTRHPATPIQAYIKQVYDRHGYNVYGYNGYEQAFFQSPALAQLTHFELSSNSSAVFYDNFKGDLLNFLHNAPNLVTLRIYRGPIEDNGFMVYPEMLSQIQNTHFPKLVALHLSTRVTIFTQKELEVWGFQQGWPELQQLSLLRGADLIPFISRVPRLIYLHLTADQAVGMDNLSRCLTFIPPNAQPLGVLDSLVYNHYLPSDSGRSSSHVVPWCIVDKVKDTLIRYNSVHQPYEVTLPGYATPSCYQLRLLQGTCPKLTELAVDVDVNTDEHEGTDVLKSLAKFPHLEKLLLYIHRPKNHTYWHPDDTEWHFDPWAESMEAYELITQDRPTTYADLAIEFKEIYDYADMLKKRRTDDWTFRTDNYGQLWCHDDLGESWYRDNSRQDWHRFDAGQQDMDLVNAYKARQALAYLEDEQLKVVIREEKHRCSFYGRSTLMLEGVVQDPEQAMKDELERRQKRTRLVQMFGDSSFTLYDRWAGSKRM